MGCGASHERAEPMVGSAGFVPTAASTPVAASEKTEKAAVENLVAEADEAVAAITEGAKMEKVPASKSGSEADDEQTSAQALSGAAERVAAEEAAAEKAAAEKAAAEFEIQEAPGGVRTNAAIRYGKLFEMTTPMLVMPFGVFKAQGRIMKSTKAWRDEALAAGSLVEHEEGSSQIAIFISHTWWDRSFADASNDPNNPYDKGAPDWQTGKNKNLKWRVLCAGVERLIKIKGLKEEDVSLWVDWQSIYQDDEAEKLKGVVSLIRYATLCQYMLVPTDQEFLPSTYSPHDIPAYGSRGWW